MRSRVKRQEWGAPPMRTVLFVAALGLLSVLAYRQIARMVDTRVPLWVSAADLRAGETVTGASLIQLQATPPPGALVDRLDIEGRVLVTDKAAGQPFVARDLAPRLPPELTSTIPAGRLLATVRIDAMDMPAQELRAGNRLDIVEAAPDGVRVVAHDAYMMGTMRAPSASAGESGRIAGIDLSVPGSRDSQPSTAALVLAIFPQDVFPLAAAEASGRKLKIVLHSANELASGQLLSVQPLVAASSQVDVEAIRGSTRDRLRVAQR